MNFEFPKIPALIDAFHPAAAPEAPAAGHGPAESVPAPGDGSGLLAAAGELFQGLFDDGPLPIAAAGAGGIGGGGKKIPQPVKPIPKKVDPVPKTQKAGDKKQHQQQQQEPEPEPEPKPQQHGHSGESSFETEAEREKRTRRTDGGSSAGTKDKKKEGMFPNGLFGAPPAEEVARARALQASGAFGTLLFLVAPEIAIPAAIAAMLLAPSAEDPTSGLGPADAPPNMI